MQRKRVHGGQNQGFRKRFTKPRRNFDQVILRSTGTEIKTLDVTNGGAPPMSTVASTTFTSNILNFIPTGTDIYQRIGRKVSMKSLHIKGRLAASGNPAINDFVRLMVVYDRQNNVSAGPTSGDIFLGQDAAGLTSTTAWDFKNINNTARYKVLMDKSYNLPQFGITMGDSVYRDANQETCFDEYIKLKGAEAQWTTGSNLPDSGALFFIIYGVNLPAAAPTTVQWVSRLRYSDA